MQLPSQLLLPRLQRLQDQRQGGQAPHGLVQAPRPCQAAEAPGQPLQIMDRLSMYILQTFMTALAVSYWRAAIEIDPSLRFEKAS